MMQITIHVNGRQVTDTIEPRMHLADFLREHLNLTGTHLRCEQGACGACTLLIDGQPARSCITYAMMCDGASVRTIEGLENDPIVMALRTAFAEEHGLQCGFCTPGMLMTARDIVLRIPDATTERVRLELSGNLCRCTGYVNIVKAIMRVLGERRSQSGGPARELGPVGPVGARHGSRAASASNPRAMDASARDSVSDTGLLGLGGRKPTIEIRKSFSVARPVAEVWAFFANPARVVTCLPGASIVRQRGANDFDGAMSIKLGPITANFTGRARLTRDDNQHSGVIVGSGNDRGGGSRAAGEVEYAVRDAGSGQTTVALTIRALLAGPLAQFGRSGIVDDLVDKMTERFATNLGAMLSGQAPAEGERALEAGSLFWSLFWSRLKKLFGGAGS
ncbi:MAG TPA: 2Fe-2S iron-sulfur cluster-binding protein [Pseudolabrys sp.]|nr:2Fe-2S iron-sulfur cluster-binding protein [Pseudolabrys sp.]